MREEKGEQMNSSGPHAIVVGASMAGMLAARALSDICERVTVLERDVLPEGPELRPGVPQARHLHALLPRGRRILERYFPGITSELTDAGAEILDVANDIAWFTPQGWGVRFASEFEGVASTRALLDHMVRVRLKEVSNVEIRPQFDVTGLAGRPERVEGVKLHRDRHDRSETVTLRADLVVVATGRNSAVPGWVRGLGLPKPETTYVNAHIGYATQVFHRPESFQESWRALFLQAAPPVNRRAGILFPVEGNRWMVTLQGADSDYPPLDRAGFLEFTRSLRSPLLYEAIRNAEPLGSITGYRSTENRLFHYERLKQWPEGLFVLGDTVCAFNPVYGQGMTTAALAAEDLAKCLREGRGDLVGVARRFQQRLARINKAPWMLATSEDLRYPRAEGATADSVTRHMHRYMDRVLRSATSSVVVRRHFLEVQGMLKGPSAVFHPSVLLRVAGQALAHSLAFGGTTMSSKHIDIRPRDNRLAQVRTEA
jgi:2-polyprenyl-6-methoxyphenol hydroxylase-like FAD-dependent oxidoreductase